MAMIFSTITYAQNRVSEITISKIAIDRGQQEVVVRFTASIGKKAVKRNKAILVNPELTDGTNRWSLPVIIAQRHVSRVQLEREILATGNEEQFKNTLFTRNGKVVEYSATVPYQGWMEEAELSVVAVSYGCCSVDEPVALILPEELPTQQRQPEPVYADAPKTTADKLVNNYPFVSAEPFEEIRPGRLSDEERGKAINVYYAQGSATIVRDYKTNEEALYNLMTVIKAIENSNDSEVTAIAIAGFTSPEGSYQVNEKLGMNRANSLKRYILDRSRINPSKIKVYNGYSDWQGLRLLVEQSNMPRKLSILDILDNTPVWDSRRNEGRMGELMRLGGGEPYRYMLREFFPLLRASAYITIYYKNK
jgi:outer membrane protein OmpA-like peptidoglycan-associated protein